MLQAHDLEMKGAYGRSAYSACLVIIEDEDYFDRIPEASDDDIDTLDMAFGWTEISHLGW
jgi:hypothetical protein